MIRNGAVRLFHLAGTDVLLHWSWLIIAYIDYQTLRDRYSSPAWIFAETAVFILLVALHEAGHVVACRMVGGVVPELMISFFGRATTLQPPRRPWPLFITYLSGPLVNAMLLPALIGLYYTAYRQGWVLHPVYGRDLGQFLLVSAVINGVVLIYNLLPVYPLDGGQVLRALLWVAMGPAWSLRVACALGLVGTVGLVAMAWWLSSFWLLVSAVFVALRCWAGFSEARMINVLQQHPRHEHVACPRCHAKPLRGAQSRCFCGEHFDVFAGGGVCPTCGTLVTQVRCPECQHLDLLAAWTGPVGFFPLQGAPVPPPPGGTSTVALEVLPEGAPAAPSSAPSDRQP